MMTHELFDRIEKRTKDLSKVLFSWNSVENPGNENHVEQIQNSKMLNTPQSLQSWHMFELSDLTGFISCDSVNSKNKAL